MLRIVILPHVLADRKSPMQQKTTYSSNLIDQTSDGHDPVSHLRLCVLSILSTCIIRFHVSICLWVLNWDANAKSKHHLTEILHETEEERVNTEMLEQQLLVSRLELLIHR